MTIMNTTNTKNGLIRDNEQFVTLIQVARENEEIRNQLLVILSQDAFNRASIINSFIEDMRLKNAPKELISAIACLLDNGIAERALEILSK
jgi:hypothetical protein